MKKLFYLILFFIGSLNAQQFARPISDLDNTGVWTTQPLWSNLDDNVSTITSGNDYVKNDGSAESTEPFTVDLGALSDPYSSSGHIIEYYAAKFTSGGAIVDFTVELRQGYVNESSQGTLIASAVQADIQQIFNIGNMTTYELTSSEADAITDYSDLQFRIFCEKNGGGANREIRLFACQIIVPPAGTPPARNRIIIIN